jgi:rhodanese-related sulfurtransferase
LKPIAGREFSKLHNSQQYFCTMVGLYWFRGCEGPQPSKVREDHWSFDQDLEGVRSLGAVLGDESSVLLQQGCSTGRNRPFAYPAAAHLRLAEFNAFRQQDATILDVRPAALFGDGHALDSLNIGIAGPSFCVWSGFFVNPDLPILLVVEYEADAPRAQLELARIGFDQVVGFITADDLDETQQITQIGARDLVAFLESPKRPIILDVRSAQEWSQDHLEGAMHIPLPQLLRRLGGFPREAPLVVVCGSGYRSSIAASLLESEGFERLSNVMGGMHAVRHAKRPRLRAVELAESALTWEI